MTTQTTAKLAALGIALMMNFVMMGAVAYVFNVQTGTGHVAEATLAAL
jgi:Pyruvate/2-oxoacid:ferredoxin oxidoreductase gamma subunit